MTTSIKTTTMKTIQIEAIRDKDSGCYLTYKNRQWGTVHYNGNAYVEPSDLICKKADPKIFECDHSEASFAMVSDSEIEERIIERGDYTEEEWSALSEAERDEAIEEYGIAMQMDSAEVPERDVEQLILTFKLDQFGTITRVKSKKVSTKFDRSSYRIVLGERLKAFREENGLSAYKVAHQGNISISNVTAVEKGATNYTIDSFLGYIRGCDLYLYFGTKGNTTKGHDFDDLINKGRQNYPS